MTHHHLWERLPALPLLWAGLLLCHKSIILWVWACFWILYNFPLTRFFFSEYHIVLLIAYFTNCIMISLISTSINLSILLSTKLWWLFLTFGISIYILYLAPLFTHTQYGNHVKVMNKLFSLIVMIFLQYIHISKYQVVSLNIPNFCLSSYSIKWFKNLMCGFKIFNMWYVGFCLLSWQGVENVRWVSFWNERPCLILPLTICK